MLIPNRENTAYDMDLFDDKEKDDTKIKSKPGVKTIAKRGNMFVILFAAIVATTLPAYTLVSKVQLSEISGQIIDATAELELALNENLRLQTELDNLVTIAKVEEYARELGMQKITTSQGKHIILDTGGVTEVAAKDDNAAVSVSRWFSNVLEYLGFK